MNDKFEYLSDEELLKLISDTETSGLLQAPPSFERAVLGRIENVEEQQQDQIISFEEKKKQFARFRFQVCMAMAAAILFMVVAPLAMNTEGGKQFRAATQTRMTERNAETNFVAGFLGNHVISDAMTAADSEKDMEE